MGAYRRFIVVMSLAVVMVRPSPAAAQLSSRDLSSSSLQIPVGQKVTVTTADGRIVKGQVLELSPATLNMGQGGERTTSLAIADVRRVQATDSVTDGAIKGALSLGLIGLLAGAWADAGNAVEGLFGGSLVLLLGGEPEPIKEPKHYLTGALVGVGVGALLGYAMDAGKEKTVYERGTLGVSVAVSPIVSAAGNGVGVQVRW